MKRIGGYRKKERRGFVKTYALYQQKDAATARSKKLVIDKKAIELSE